MAKKNSKDFNNLMIAEWNVLTFTEYIKHKHVEVFGIPYAPFRSWGLEQGLLGDLIGTKSKERKYSNYLVKRFIDKAFETYKPTSKYPGTSFGFSYTYRREVLQQVIAEEKETEKYTEAVKKQMPYDDIMDLL